jgi:hypothetical protein
LAVVEVEVIQAPQRAVQLEAQVEAQAIVVQVVPAQQGKVTTVQHLPIDQLTVQVVAPAEPH